jgi:hypothetical protein
MKVMQISKDTKGTAVEIEEFHTRVEKMGEKFVERELVDKLQERQDVFESIESMDVITNVFFPKMNSFSSKIDDYNADHELVRECVRRFDEALSAKATRVELRTLAAKLEDTFISQRFWDDLVAEHDEMKSEALQQKSNFEDEVVAFRQQESENMDMNITSSIETHFARYEEVYKEFKKFFNRKGLTEAFDLKADIGMIGKINQAKADKG